jgi:hypothetical protein
MLGATRVTQLDVAALDKGWAIAGKPRLELSHSCSLSVLILMSWLVYGHLVAVKPYLPMRAVNTLTRSLTRIFHPVSPSSCGIGSIANPQLNDDSGTIITFPDETFGLGQVTFEGRKQDT